MEVLCFCQVQGGEDYLNCFRHVCTDHDSGSFVVSFHCSAGQSCNQVFGLASPYRIWPPRRHWKHLTAHTHLGLSEAIAAKTHTHHWTDSASLHTFFKTMPCCFLKWSSHPVDATNSVFDIPRLVMNFLAWFWSVRPSIGDFSFALLNRRSST